MSCCKTIFILCDPVPACIYQLIVKTPIISDTATIRFIDKFNKIYFVTKDSDSEGNVTIQLRKDSSDPLDILLSDLPDALLNQYSGGFKLMLLDSGNLEVKWTISGVEYDALGFMVMDITPIVDNYTIDVTFASGDAGDFNFDFGSDFFV